MITRRKKRRDETPACDSLQKEELHGSQINGITAGVRSRNDQKIQTDPHLSLQPPIFNINIHIPPHKGKNFQMYLPRLHPIVHLHFDEIARKLELRRGQNEKSTYRLFKSLLAMTSPTYGDVKFYTSHRSENGGFKESEILERARTTTDTTTTTTITTTTTTTTTTTATTSSENIPPGCRSLVNKIVICTQNTVPKRTYCHRIITPNNHQSPGMDITEINRSPRKRSMRELEEEFELKKAVVVLTDVCKSKHYKNLFETSVGVSSENGIEDSHDGLDGTESELYNSQSSEKHFIKKTEIQSFEPESSLNEKYKTDCESLLRVISPTNEVTSVKSEMNVKYNMTKSLLSLVEGCNFSEILHRFRIKKCEEHLVESVKNLNDLTVENFVSNDEHNYNGETSEQDSYHESKFVIDEIWAGGIPPGGIKSEVTIEDHFNLKISNDESKETSTCVDVKLPFDSLNASTDTQSDVEHDLLVDNKKLDVGDDEEENEVHEMFSSQKIIRATSNSEIEIVSCGTSPFLVPVNRFQFLKSDENSDCISNINLQLELIKKEMARRNMKNSNSTNKKKGKGVKKKALKSPMEGKKSKASAKQQKTDNSSQADDYIPLQATGPTRFAVAPLNKVSPYKSHGARNFKSEMLFGNRVNRFQSSDRLRIYKMKKNAGKRTSG